MTAPNAVRLTGEQEQNLARRARELAIISSGGQHGDPSIIPDALSSIALSLSLLASQAAGNGIDVLVGQR